MIHVNKTEVTVCNLTPGAASTYWGKSENSDVIVVTVLQNISMTTMVEAQKSLELRFHTPEELEHMIKILTLAQVGFDKSFGEKIQIKENTNAL